MITLATDLAASLAARTGKFVELYEIAFAGGATYYFSDQAIAWNGHAYQAYVVSRSDIKRYMSGQFDQVSVTFSNVDTGMAQFIANNNVQGAQLTIRLVDPAITDDSLPLFIGLIQQPGAVDEKQCVLNALERLGSINMNAPSRLFTVACPWPFGSDECSPPSGTSSCNQSWANCAANGNTAHFGGFRFLPVSGTFQYQEVTQSRFLLFFSRKSAQTVNVAFNSVDDTPYDVPIPIVLGRTQIQGIPIEHEDMGIQSVSLIAFCIGQISTYVYSLADNELINLARDATLHFGAVGGTVGGAQDVDPRFPGSYEYTLLAYMGLTLAGDDSSSGNAPSVVSVIMGKVVDFYDSTGAWASYGWTDNPIWNTRAFLALSYYEGGMGIPDGWLDDARNYRESLYCDELVADTTNDQTIFLPDPMPDGMTAGENWRAYRSTCVDGLDPSADGPYTAYIEGVSDDTSVTPASVNVKRFTLNVAIAQQQTAIDVLQQKLLPAFRGYNKQNKAGQIQICVEKANPNALVTTGVAAGVTAIPCNTPGSFNPGDLLILGTYTLHAEIATVLSTTGTAVNLTAATTKVHAVGEELLKIARAYDDSNIVDGTMVQYPLSDRQSTINRINVAYVDAPCGFEARTLYVNDYANQSQVNAVNDQDLDGSGIDSYFQAWRIGEWQRALFRDVNKFVQLRAGIQSSDLEIGDDIIAVTAPEHGIICLPFRVIELGFAADNEVDITGQIYSSDVYNDEAPQSTRTVPTIFAPTLNAPSGPMPYRPAGSPWLIDDALFPGLATFRTYTGPQGQLSLFDVPPINSLSAATSAPAVPTYATITTGGGGVVPAGNALVTLVSVDAAGAKSAPSHYVQANVKVANSTITLAGVTFDAGAVKWEMYYGPDAQHMWLVGSDAVANPVTAGVLWVPDGIGPPDTDTAKFRVLVTPIRHGGIWGGAASAIAANAITVPQTATANEWAGRVLSLYASAKVIESGGFGSAAFDGLSFVRPANWNVTANDVAGVMTVTQSTAVGGFPITFSGDVFVMRAQANIASANTIGDTAFVSAFAASGLGTDAEAGKVVWIMAGTGAGQRRQVASNTSTTLTVGVPWDVIPDATSVFVILESGSQTVECPPFTDAGATSQSLAVLTALFTSVGTQSFLVQIVTEDADGNLSPVEDAPWQEVYLDPGADLSQTTVTAASYTVKATDAVVTLGAGAANVYLPDATTVHRQPVWVINASAAAITVWPSGSDTIEGNSSLLIPPGGRYQLMPNS